MRYRYRVDDGPTGTVELPPGASEGDVALAVSRQRGRAVELAGDGGGGGGLGAPHPDDRLGEPSALTSEHWEFTRRYLAENPHVGAVSGPGYAFGDQASEGLRAELDTASRFRGPIRSGVGFRSDGSRLPHGQQPLQEPDAGYYPRPGESHFAWRQRRALEDGPEMMTARMEAGEYIRKYNL